MNVLQKRHERINYLSDANERKRLTMYLQAGYFRKTTDSIYHPPVSGHARIWIYSLSGLCLLLGLLFIIF